MQHEQRLDGRRHGDIDQQRITGLLTRSCYSDAIDVSLHDVAPKPVSETQRPLEIHASSLLPIADRGALHRGQHRGRFEPAGSELPDSETCAVDGDALTGG